MPEHDLTPEQREQMERVARGQAMTHPGGLKPRPCIICGTPTLGRGGRYKHPDCRAAGESWLACALRRNQDRARPKPVTVIVAKAIEAGHPVPPELGLYLRGVSGEGRPDAG